MDAARSTAEKSARSSSSSCTTTTAAATRSRQTASGGPRSGPVLAASLYDGEIHDARLTDPTWSTTDYDDRDWAEVKELASVAHRLVAASGPPVRRIETLRPVSVAASPSGATIVDFGQNVAGRVRITVRGPAGHEVTLRHAEVLEHGELATRPLRGAAATDTYILAGDGVETYEPAYTIHGFRYVQVDGWPGSVTPDAIEAVVCHSDMAPTGTFHCSHDGLNRLHENVRWSMRGNFVDLPTDCPQRDERLGWTGDIQVFAPAASFLYDCREFLVSWLQDLAAEQRELGTVPPYVPWVELGFRRGRQRRGVMPRSSFRGCCTSGSVTPRCSAASTRACGPGSTRSPT